MSKVFDLQTLSPTRRRDLRTRGDGSYTFDLRNVPADALDRASKGFSAAALSLMSGRFVIFETFYDGSDGSIEQRRATPIPEQFNESERAIVACGSFNLSALDRRTGGATFGNSLFERRAICLDCGKVWREMPARHRCGEILCGCGNELTTDDEKRALRCTACAIKAAYNIYGYHGRPNRGNPLFSNPEKRATLPHIGAEIEIDGGCVHLSTKETRELSAILNHDPFRPFIQFENDGSLCGGVECITQPTTYDGYRKRGAAITAFYQKAVDVGGAFDRRNGLHFHIDRAFFDDGTAESGAKAAVLLDYMFYKYFDFFAAISGRKAGCFSYARKKSGVDGLASAALKVWDNEHSNAVNGSGSNTIEIRIFGGRIATGQDFFAALDIVQAAARWAKATTLATASKATPESLVKYLKNPENVLTYLYGLRGDRQKTAAGEKGIETFKDALQTAIDKAAERRERGNA